MIKLKIKHLFTLILSIIPIVGLMVGITFMITKTHRVRYRTIPDRDEITWGFNKKRIIIGCLCILMSLPLSSIVLSEGCGYQVKNEKPLVSKIKEGDE